MRAAHRADAAEHPSRRRVRRRRRDDGETLLAPAEKVTDEQLERGLTSLARDGLWAQVVGALTSGVLLTGFALELGASNFVVGCLAAIPFFMQFAQLPAILLVERLRRRRRIAVLALTLSRSLLLPLAFLPFLASQNVAQGALIAGVGLSAALGAVAACSWNSWIRDLVPEGRLGRFFARRLTLATGWSMVAGLAGGGVVELWSRHQGDPVYSYTILFILGLAAGAISTWHLAQVPEPPMAPPAPHGDFFQLLREPFRDLNFSRLMIFMAAWNFAVNLAAPFFAVYIIQELGFTIGFVVILAVISQSANVLMLQVWGRLSDRFSNKSVLATAAPIFLVCIFAWSLLPVNSPWTAPLLVVLHVFMGLAAAGVGLATGNIGLKLAPRGGATAFLAANSLFGSLAAGVAPIVGGLFADDFAARELSLVMRWSEAGAVTDFITVQIRHWDFFFLLAAAVGLFALHRLSLVREEGEIEEGLMMNALLIETRRSVRNLSSVAGLRLSVNFPFGRAVDGPEPKEREVRSGRRPL